MVSIGEASRRRTLDVRWVSLAILALLVFLVVAHWKYVHNQVVGSPSRGQVTGTWGGDYGLGLVLHPNGTFTSAALPQHVGTAAPELDGTGSYVLGAWSAHGTWVIGPGHLGSSAESVIFTVDCGAVSGRCAGHPRTFELQLETNSPQGGGGPALFYFLDRTRDLARQYPFVRVPS